MTKKLIITEKPSVARDITKALGGFEEKQKGEYFESDDYVCTFAVGHILALFSPEDIKPEYKRWRLQDLPIIPEKFQTKPMDNQKGRLKVIKKLINRKNVTGIINACDAAREGELIFREIVTFLESDKPIYRLWLQSMTKKAIVDGFSSLKDGLEFDNLGVAAECRAHADWLIGMNATRALTVRLKSRNQRGLSWSAGRVQTPTLSLLVDRENEILDHEPQVYWRVKAQFKAEDHDYEALYYDPTFKVIKGNRDLKDDRIFDRKIVDQILEVVKGGAKATAKETRKPSPRKPPTLFDLTSLQRAANTRFGWPATRTLKAAQRCYEAHKVLTYPRTSSKVLPENYREEVDRVLNLLSTTEAYGVHAAQLFKQPRQNEDKIYDDKGVTDHFAIIPTGEKAELSGDDQKLFDLVTRQFIAAFYPPSVYEDVVRITTVEDFSFKSKPPKVLKEAGWEAVFGKQPGVGEDAFPPLEKGKNNVEGVAVTTKESADETLETKPPQRISEAKLLSLMENAGRAVEDEELASALKNAEGLGTAATRADIIENLKTREYVDTSLRVTVKGIRLVDILHRIGASRLTSAKLTGELELHLSEVERGERTREAFLKEVEFYTKEVVEASREFDFEKIYPDKDPLGACPNCKSQVYERAWFYGCTEATTNSREKKCSFLIWKDNNGRYINRNVVKTLLTDGVTRELEGFRSLNGQIYKAVLALEGGTLVRKSVNYADSDSSGGFEVNEEPITDCPIHDNCKVIETSFEFICEEKHKAKKNGDNQTKGVSVPRLLCKREVKREEVKDLVEKGETEYLSGFISKKGRKFRARLRFDENSGGFSFEFPGWGKKKGDKEEESSEGKDAGGEKSEATPEVSKSKVDQETSDAKGAQG